MMQVTLIIHGTEGLKDLVKFFNQEPKLDDRISYIREMFTYGSDDIETVELVV